MRVHRQFLDDRDEGYVAPGVFQDHGNSMSTDWAKYSTPRDTKERARRPADNGVISLNVGRTRREAKQIVLHDPLFDNRAHTSVVGEKSTEARVKLLRIASVNQLLILRPG